MAGWNKIFFQDLIHLNDETIGTVSPFGRLRTAAKALNTIKI